MHARYSMAILAVCAFTAGGCSDRSAPDAADTTAVEPSYTMSDTVPYENLVTGGRLAILHRNGVYIDSVDVDFGVQPVGVDSVIFLPVRAAPDGSAGTATSIADHVLYDGATRMRTEVSTIVPHFDSHFSSPAVLDGALYYWGIFQANGIDSVNAIRYEFRRRRLNAIPVPAKMEGTDDRFYFKPPYLEGKEFVFKAPNGEWRFRTPRQ